MSRMSVGAAVLAAAASMLGCGNKSSNDDGGLGPTAACEAYIACATSVIPSEVGILLEAYGPSGTCWENTETADLCDQACVGALEVLSLSAPDDPACEGPTGTGDGGTADTGGPPVPSAGWDILFVIDNSGSMGEEQALLATAAQDFVGGLEGANVDYRIGITTTDNGNFWCSGGAGGAFRLTSCRSRQQEFVFTGMPPVDATQGACLDVCANDSIQIQPTPTEENPTPIARPWVERIGGSSNLAGGTTSEALGCFLPQGINGCGFESPLESGLKAIARTQDLADAAAGFLRTGAGLAIIYVSDEADCSARSEEIFRADGDKTFWSNPMDGSPTSAVCWNAGVSCEGGPGIYDGCSPVDLLPDGTPASPDQAVLFPVDRYVQQLNDIDGRPVVVYGIVGVPEGFPGDPLVYQDTQDMVFQLDFGIGPGCESVNGKAVPPVRLRALAGLFPGDQNLFSICAPDYGSTLSAISADLVARAQP